MAWYVVTDRSDSNWDDTHKYKYRYESRDGSKVAQDEFELRKRAGRPAFLWRWEDNEPTLIEQHSVETV